MPRAGILDLRFLVSPPNLEERPIADRRAVATLLKAVDDFDDAKKAMELAYEARVRLGIDDALALTRGLVRREATTSVSKEDLEYSAALQAINSNDRATLTITGVQNTQNTSYTNNPASKIDPICTLSIVKYSIPCSANDIPSALFANQ